MSSEDRPIIIGLGGQRCGSTWLHDMLSKHPEVQPARGMKEVHFFSSRWENGTDWYFDLWRPEDAGPDVRIRWESTPVYLYGEEVIKRIRETLPEPRFVVLLRDPVGRSKSHFERSKVNRGHRMTFEQAALRQETIIRYSEYAQFLERYFNAFGRENVFVGFYEDIARDPKTLFRNVSKFIGVSSIELSQDTLTRRVNAVRTPRNAAVHKRLFKTKRWLKRQGYYWPIDVARRAGLLRLMTSENRSRRSPGLTPADIARLEELRARQVHALSRLGIDASHWFDSASGAGKQVV